MKSTASTIVFCLTIPFLFTTFACSKNNDDTGQPASVTEVEGIYFVTRYGYNGGTFSYFEPFVLFKDGSIRKNLQQPVETLDIAEDKTSNSSKWGFWKKDNGNVQIQWRNENETWKNGEYYVSFPADNEEKLNGTYTSFFALANSQRGQRYSFSANGSFSMSRQTGSGNQILTGTYELKGFGIYFTYNNGSREAWSFCFYPKKGVKNPDAFLMAEDNFTKN